MCRYKEMFQYCVDNELGLDSVRKCVDIIDMCVDISCVDITCRVRLEVSLRLNRSHISLAWRE